ncbi:LexA repressor [Alphaproteobacteria bacterium SO-S41]|nr:LexA repressor [Alphaproteobacteria bacterium SO-S41]
MALEAHECPRCGYILITQKPLDGLTPQQALAFWYIVDFLKARGHSPSLEELRIALDLKSRSGVHRILTLLVDRGWLLRRNRRSRGLALSPAATAAIANQSVNP